MPDHRENIYKTISNTGEYGVFRDWKVCPGKSSGSGCTFRTFRTFLPIASLSSVVPLLATTTRWIVFLFRFVRISLNRFLAREFANYVYPSINENASRLMVGVQPSRRTAEGFRQQTRLFFSHFLRSLNDTRWSNTVVGLKS